MNKQSAYEILISGAIPQDVCLNSVFEIDQVLLRLIELDDQLDHLKGLKKYRVDSANMAIKDVEDKVVQIRDLIHRTMVELSPGEKVLQFPSIGKVSRRKVPDGWSIDDEEALIKFLESKGLKDAAVKVKEVLDIKAAKKIIDDLSVQGETVPGVTKQKGGESISITFEDAPKLAKITTVLPNKTDKIQNVSTKQNLNDLDELDI
jgi:hypothetical protein